MKKVFLFTFLLLHFTFFAQDGLSDESSNSFNVTASSETTPLTFVEEIDNTLMVNLYNSPLFIKKEATIVNEELTSDILRLRLEKLNEKTPFNVVYNTTIESFIRLYLETRKDDVANLMDKAAYYFPIFEEHLDNYNLPLEIKYLAIVESALEPTSKSGMGAKGLWQFMYHTGKQFGLNITSYVDERSDPIKATVAACKYLESLYATFNDWDLTLAAYNSGPGNVTKAIRRSGGQRNYWKIRKYLPSETRGYLPAFYATFYLFEYGDKHNIYPKNARITYFETDTIHIKRRLTFQKIEKEIGIDNDLLKRLNPHYKLGIIPANDNIHVLTLPKSLVGKFISNEHKIYNLPEKRTLSKHIIPSSKEVFKMSPKTFIKEPSAIKQATFKTYIVKEGDSLFLISKKFPDVSIHQIRNWNNIWGQAYLAPGTKLKVLTKSE